MRSSSGIRQNSRSTSSAAVASATGPSFDGGARDRLPPLLYLRIVRPVEDVRHARGLAPAREERAVARPRGERPVPVPVGRDVAAQVEQHPLGGLHLAEAQRVVETEPAADLAGGARD